MSEARNEVLGHADEADGIEEYDNPLPDWWLGLFVGTIIWAGIYTVHYHLIGHRSQVKALAAEMADARARWPQAVTTTHVVLSHDAIAAGEGIFKANCAGCHGDDMRGKIGPNLLDSTWIHGGNPDEIVHTITAGVPEKGMLTWGPILGAEKINEVAAYVISRNHQELGIHDDDEHEGKEDK